MPKQLNWQAALGDAHAKGQPHVLITVLAVAGSAPRQSGQKMVVTADGVHDTIGGGQLEQLAIERARSLLDGELSAQQQVEHYPLAAAAAQCCGGAMTLLFEPLCFGQPDVVLFGAGHVGQAILNLLASLPVTTTVVDSRADWLDQASAQRKVAASAEQLAQPLSRQMLAQWVPANAWVFVLTHDHVTDYTLLKALTKRSDLNFLGLIGSSTKWQNFSRRLRRDGVSDSELLRVQCPIGAGRSQFKEPMAIAVDVVAKLLRDISESAKAVNRHSTVQAGSGMQPVTRNLLRERTPGLFR